MLFGTEVLIILLHPCSCQGVLEPRRLNLLEELLAVLHGKLVALDASLRAPRRKADGAKIANVVSETREAVQAAAHQVLSLCVLLPMVPPRFRDNATAPKHPTTPVSPSGTFRFDSPSAPINYIPDLPTANELMVAVSGSNKGQGRSNGIRVLESFLQGIEDGYRLLQGALDKQAAEIDSAKAAVSAAYNDAAAAVAAAEAAGEAATAAEGPKKAIVEIIVAYRELATNGGEGKRFFFV